MSRKYVTVDYKNGIWEVRLRYQSTGRTINLSVFDEFVDSIAEAQTYMRKHDTYGMWRGKKGGAFKEIK